ncbi:uncharacterized protein L201_002248 [Kwoniella dendrophila CBS 6074]|uniref:Uncharacterized protein n=1 Tax=Kwoniella dendrophila CBS 6074 TaxID=1295534 RepID=A0AAX4JPR7_9TREE
MSSAHTTAKSKPIILRNRIASYASGPIPIYTEKDQWKIGPTELCSVPFHTHIGELNDRQSTIKRSIQEQYRTAIDEIEDRQFPSCFSDFDETQKASIRTKIDMLHGERHSLNVHESTYEDYQLFHQELSNVCKELMTEVSHVVDGRYTDDENVKIESQIISFDELSEKEQKKGMIYFNLKDGSMREKMLSESFNRMQKPSLILIGGNSNYVNGTESRLNQVDIDNHTITDEAGSAVTPPHKKFDRYDPSTTVGEILSIHPEKNTDENTLRCLAKLKEKATELTDKNFEELGQDPSELPKLVNITLPESENEADRKEKYIFDEYEKIKAMDDKWYNLMSSVKDTLIAEGLVDHSLVGISVIAGHDFDHQNDVLAQNQKYLDWTDLPKRLGREYQAITEGTLAKSTGRKEKDDLSISSLDITP